MRHLLKLLVIIALLLIMITPVSAARIGIAVVLDPERTEQAGSPYHAQFEKIYYDYLLKLYGPGNEVVPRATVQAMVRKHLERDLRKTALSAMSELGVDYLVLGAYNARIYIGTPNMFTSDYSVESHTRVCLFTTTADMARAGDVAALYTQELDKRVSSRGPIEPALQEYMNELVSVWPQRAAQYVQQYPSWRAVLYPYF